MVSWGGRRGRGDVMEEGRRDGRGAGMTEKEGLDTGFRRYDGGVGGCDLELGGGGVRDVVFQLVERQGNFLGGGIFI